MTEKIIAAGSGGQGIMLLGKFLAEAGMRKGMKVTWLPAYCAEVRGGTCNCMIVLSDKEIGSPYISGADTLIIMNQPSMEKFALRLQHKGLMLYNSSLVKKAPVMGEARVIGLPFSETAASIGSIRSANMVALGAYLELRGHVSCSEMIEIANEQKKQLKDLNSRAINAGAELARKKI